MKAPFPWFGGKRSQCAELPWIPAAPIYGEWSYQEATS